MKETYKYRLSMVEAMLAHETAPNEEHYGAKLSHWDDSVKTINIEAEELMVLRGFYLSKLKEDVPEEDGLVVSDIPYVSVWDGGYEVESTCTVNLRSGEILDIKMADLPEGVLEDLEVLDEEYIVLNDEQVTVYEDENGKRHFNL